MVILRSQNKITDFFMILAWACPFNLFTAMTIMIMMIQSTGVFTTSVLFHVHRFYVYHVYC